MNGQQMNYPAFGTDFSHIPERSVQASKKTTEWVAPRITNTFGGGAIIALLLAIATGARSFYTDERILFSFGTLAITLLIIEKVWR